MTFSQDPPQSRRAIREREAEAARAASSREPVTNSDENPTTESSSQPVAQSSVGPEPLTYVTQSRAPLPQYDTPVAQPLTPPSSAPVTQPDAPYRYRDFSPEGAARPGAWRQEQGEPADLDYRTQGRADVPVPTSEPVASESAPESPVSSGPVYTTPPVSSEGAYTTPPVSAHPEATMTRRELRALREAQDREAAEANASQQPVSASAAPVPPAEPAASAQPVVSEHPVHSEQPVHSGQPVHSEQPAHSAQPAYSAPPVAAEQPTPPPLIEPEAPESDALASFEALFRSTAEPQAPASEPVEQSTPPAPVEPEASVPPAPSFGDFTRDLRSPSPADQATVAPPSFQLAPGTEPAPAFPMPIISAGPFTSPISVPGVMQPPSTPSAAEATPAPVQPSAAPVQPSAAPAFPQSVPLAPAEQQAHPAEPTTASQPPVAERPRNHWSRQSEIDESSPELGSVSTRSVGAVPTTSNALVLPEIPNHDVLTSTIGGTGEVMVTGSISLPSSLSSTGALPAQLDESDLDGMLEPGDRQVASTDSQPVRAIRAVSTHTSSRDLIGTVNPKRGNRALTALIISAAGMAVVVVALLVVALTQGVLG
ncbi:hypothetical protein [Salinibacterium sp. ZJ77]|uniref:hypothetical protein n=1 Tax=Salinibacterium sp. ZJ77 TaxID=2708337 RepID=UPI001423FFFF|nr:hypothetical protein [Salinibacterium sp. ZJ77]